MFFDRINLGDVALIVLVFLLVGLTFSVLSNTLRRKQQYAIHTRLLEKFTSSQDFSTFLQTPGGQQYVKSLMEDDSKPGQTIVNSVRSGIIIAVVGGGLFVASFFLKNQGAGISGLMLLLVGVGFILSAAASYKLSFKLGLIRDKSEPPKV